MIDFSVFNSLIDNVSYKMRFTPKTSPVYDDLSQVYQVLNSFDSFKAYKLQARIKNGLQFQNTAHLLDTVRNISQLL